MATRAHLLLKCLCPATSTTTCRSITTTSFLLQEPELHDPSPPPTTPLPPNPSTGSPLYQENWRSPRPDPLLSQSLVPLGLIDQAPSLRIQAFSETLDLPNLLNVFANWMTSQRWSDLKQLFEFWIRSLDDKNGKPNRPNVDLYNHYLRANLMMGGSAGELLDLVAQMEGYGISPNTASYNLVLKAMYQSREAEAAEKLLDR